MARLSNTARRLATEAASLGWTYSPEAKDVRLAYRWRWPVRFHHPFHGTGLTSRDSIGQLLMGTTRAGRRFWAFQHSYALGERLSIFRSVAFIYTGQPLPTVSVVPRTVVGPIRRGLFRHIARAAERSQDPSAKRVSERFDGLSVGGDDFRQQYRVDADDQSAAGWLVGLDTQRRLLADSALSLASIDSDILCWCDRGELSLATVETMLELLDTVPIRM